MFLQLTENCKFYYVGQSKFTWRGEFSCFFWLLSSERASENENPFLKFFYHLKNNILCKTQISSTIWILLPSSTLSSPRELFPHPHHIPLPNPNSLQFSEQAVVLYAFHFCLTDPLAWHPLLSTNTKLKTYSLVE